MAVSYLIGFIIGIVPVFLFLTYLIKQSVIWFFKKDKKKSKADLTDYFEAMKPAVLILVVAGFLNLILSTYQYIGLILLVLFVGALFSTHYVLKNWWKPYVVALGLILIIILFAFVWEVLGLLIVRNM